MSSKGGSGGSASAGRATGAASGGSGSSGGGDFKSALSRAERNALQDYTGNSFALINARLRGIERNLDPTLRRIMRNTESALDKASLSRDRVLFRGVRDDFAAKLSAQVKAGTLKVGTKFTDKGFTSTTTRFSSARRFADNGKGVILRIRARKGSKGADLGGLSTISYKGKALEREVLFQRGRTFRVRKAEMRRGIPVITVDIS